MAYSIRLAALAFVLAAGCSPHAGTPDTSATSATSATSVQRTGARVELRSPKFVLALDLSAGLRAVRWENRVAGRALELAGGSELEVDLDAAERRIGITGWKFARSQETDGPPDEERGFRAGFARPEFDDASWTPVMAPNGDFAPTGGFAWVRRRIRLDDADRGKPIFFTMGGWGLFDFRYLRVFVNGQPVGVRDSTQRRAGPLTVSLQPGSDAFRVLHFGGDNVIALQLSRYQNRPARLDAVDPERRWELSRFYWPPTFEQSVSIGGDRATPRWKVTNVTDRSIAGRGEVVIALAAVEPALEATVTYRWSSGDAVLRKSVQLRNAADHPIRVLDVCLGDYRAIATAGNGGQGHPGYADGAFFLSIAHPAGWATADDADGGEVRLHHHPGVVLAPGERFDCFETVYGVSRAGEIAQAFKGHIRSRMRRSIRGHDRPYAFFEPFGSDGETDKYDAREDRLLPNLAALEAFGRETGCRFDAWGIEFWENPLGDRSTPDPARFPNGLRKIQESLGRMGTALGLWLDITGPDQSIGQNPAVAPTLNFDPAYGTERRTMCLATEPMPSLDRDALLHHVRQNNVRLFKFDGYWAMCRNNAHAHLPGVYATEAIDSAFIRMLDDVDAACPDVFFQLYGGFHSPWWLLHADTIYESGIQMEAATPGPWPTLFARDGVTRVLDQATVYAAEDVPALGKDSLGVWLSDWRWNSQIGSERWQDGFVMDLMRGSLLAQPWCDLGKLDAEQRGRMAEFIALLRAHPRCFDRPRLIVGSPWKQEPYGWCGTDGRRAFIALNNGTWEDRTVTLQLNGTWGLPDHWRWDLYRRYPHPARLRAPEGPFGPTVKIALRPFEIVLLEAVPAGEAPALGGRFADRPTTTSFAEPACSPQARVGPPDADGFRNLAFDIPATAAGGWIALDADVRLNHRPLMRTDAGSHYQIRRATEGAPAEWTPVLASQIYYKTSWQAWRAAVPPADHERTFALRIKPDAPAAAQVSYRAHFVPRPPMCDDKIGT